MSDVPSSYLPLYCNVMDFRLPFDYLLVSEALLASVNEFKLSEGPPGEFCILGISGSARFLLWRSGPCRASFL